MAPNDVDASVAGKIGPNIEVSVVAPTNTFFGTLGFSPTSSAEGLGQGRLINGVAGSWYLRTMKIAPGKSSGTCSISLAKALKPPDDAPITTMEDKFWTPPRTGFPP